MKKVTESFSLPCSVEAYWRIFFDEAYGKALYLEALGFRDYRVLEQKDGARKLRIAPKVNLPGPIASLVGDAFAYEEHGTLDRGRNVWTWKMVPSGKAFLQTSGTISVQPDGEGKCRRTDDVAVEGKVFGLGGIIESTVEKELRASWHKELAFFRRWLETHPA